MFEVLEPGFETTIQDFPGRSGFFDAGIPPSGPFDPIALRTANLLLGNSVGAAGIEITILGPRLKCAADATIALTGADLTPSINGQPVQMWRTLKLVKGDVLSFGPCKSGCRAYIGIRGGVEAPIQNGSRSTYKLGSLGGLRGDGKSLLVGDVIPTGHDTMSWTTDSDKQVSPLAISGYGKESHEVRVILGPQDDYFERASLELFSDGKSEFAVSPQSNRVGVRLKGPAAYDYRTPKERPASGDGHPSNIVLTNYPVGTINMAGVEPVVLGPDAVTFGGFCCIATVLSSDMWKIAQSKPKERLRFRAVDSEVARTIRVELEKSLSEVVLSDVS